MADVRRGEVEGDERVPRGAQERHQSLRRPARAVEIQFGDFARRRRGRFSAEPVRVLDDGPVRVLDDGLCDDRPTSRGSSSNAWAWRFRRCLQSARLSFRSVRSLAARSAVTHSSVTFVRSHTRVTSDSHRRARWGAATRARAEASHVERAHRAHVLERQRAKLDVNARHARDIDDAIGVRERRV